MIDNNPGESIDCSPATEIFLLPEHCYPSFAINSQHPTSIDYQYDSMIDREGKYSISSCADDSYHESFAVDIALPEMRSNRYDENYHKEKMIENRGPHIDDEGVFHTSQTINESTSIDSDVKPSIDIHHIPDSIGLEQVKEQRREIQEVRCRFEGYDAEQPSRTTRRLFPNRTSV
ncbi:hypothetical protein F2Q69_00006577 [Brassica cretica]|uniref:Uncharacterized protein n=1 Tax=Brassica cretica TaxID=69181 RepID=A0A8S9P2R7_BRACR|nr:hypothetical protein F2Q69_00006577 [Brassica cretica]